MEFPHSNDWPRCQLPFPQSVSGTGAFFHALFRGEGVRGSLGIPFGRRPGCVLDSVLATGTCAGRSDGGQRMEKNRMLDIVYVLGVIAVFALIGVVAWGVAKL
jgi:hypothetical protein